jgi:hypothetical protein
VNNFVKISSIFFLLWAFFGVKAFAITFNISGSGSQVHQDDEIGVNVEVSGLSSDTSYFLQTRIKSSTGNNYFGYTQDSQNNWYKYSTSLEPQTIQSQFFAFTTDANGSWSGTVKSKIDTEDSNYKGSGDYILQVLRYTGNSKSESGISNDYDFTVNDTRPTSTPTPFPTNTPTPTPKPTKTPTPAPTSTPTSTPKPTPTSKITPTPTTTKSDLKNSVDPNREGGTESAQYTTMADSADQNILGANTKLGDMKSDVPTSTDTSYNWGKLLIIMGVVLVSGACGILVYNNYKKQKSEEIASE